MIAYNRDFRAAQASVAAMAVAERGDAVWRGMRRLAEGDASGVVIVTYFAICARLRAEGIARARLRDIALAVGCALDQIDDLLVELVERQAVLVSAGDEAGVVMAVPVFDVRSPSAGLH